MVQWIHENNAVVGILWEKQSLASGSKAIILHTYDTVTLLDSLFPMDAMPKTDILKMLLENPKRTMRLQKYMEMSLKECPFTNR